MTRTTLAAILLAIFGPLSAMADTIARPPMPDWQTDPATCTWH